MSIMHELSRLQEVNDVITEHTKDASLLPQSGEQVLLDLKAENTTWQYQVYFCFYYLCPIFTAQCTKVQCAVLRSHFVCSPGAEGGPVCNHMSPNFDS